METTLIILKPDAVQRGLVGEIISRFENKGLKLVGAKLLTAPENLAKKHYADHEGKPFYPGLMKFITSSPVMVLAIQGKNAIATSRKLMGATFGFNAEPGTIRGDFGNSTAFNLIHGSDSPESAAKELAIWFDDAELVNYDKAVEAWVYDMSSGEAE